MKNYKSLKRWSILAICFTMLLGGMPTYVSAASSNMAEESVTNGDFESGALIPGWTIHSGHISLINTAIESGPSEAPTSIDKQNRRLLIESRNEKAEVRSVVSSVYENNTYQFSGQIYWENAEAGELQFGITFYDSNADEIITTELNSWSAPIGKLSTWFDFSESSTAPAGAVTAELYFRSDDNASLRAYVDNVRLSLMKDGSNAYNIWSDDFESFMMIPGWRAIAPAMSALIERFDGNHVLVLDDNMAISGDNNAKLQLRSDKYQVTPGVQYNLSAAVNSVKQTHSLEIALVFYNSSGKAITTAGSNKLYAKTLLLGQGWTNVTLDAPVTAPAEATSVEISFGSGHVSRTLAYIDDVKLLKIVPGIPEEPGSETEALLINPGFESELVDGTVPGWSVNKDMIDNGTMKLSTEIKRTGSNSLYFYDSVTGANGTGKRYQVLSNSFKVTPGDGISAESYIYKLQQTHGIVLELHFFDASGGVVTTKQQNNSAASVPATAWHKIVVPELIVPDNAVSAKVAIYSGDLAITEIYIDDVAVTIVPANHETVDDPTEIQNAGFEEELVEGAIPGWSLAPATAGILQVSDTIYHEGAKSLYFHDNSTDIGLRVLSDPVAVTPGDSMIFKSYVYVISQTHSIVPEIYYYNEKDKQVGVEQVTFSSVSLGTNKWTAMRLASDVPGGAVYARVALYSGTPSITEAYFDSLSLSVLQPEEPLNRVYGEPVSMGDMVYANLGQAGAVQTNSNGENEVYFVTNGKPGSFFALDAETGVIKFQEVIPNTVATWAMAIGEDKNVYFAGTEDGILYRYLPVTKNIEKLGYNTTDNWTWDIEIIGDKLYGGTYNSQTDGKLFEYDIKNGTFRNYGVVDEGQQYVRGIAVDDEYVYAGLGTKSIKLVKIKRDTGEKSEIPIPGYSGETGTIADVFVIGDKLFVSVSTINMVVLDMETGLVDSEFQYSNMISEPSPKDANIIYYKYLSKFYKYDMAAKQSTEIVLPYPLPDTTRVKDLSWIELKSGEKSGQTVLGMITQYGEFALIDPDDQWVSFIDLEVGAMPVNIQSLKAGVDGRLYLGGYQRGMSVYNPFTNKSDVTMTTFAQPEGIGFLNDKVYYGTYVSAIMYSYDITKEAVMNDNPKFEFDIAHQDRPFAITSGDNKLFVGTVPDYGFLGGSLVVYDEAKDQWTQYDDVVPNQSIIGLAYKDGLLYGSTTVWGGLGIDPTEPEAKIFVWDVERGQKIDEFTLDDLDIDEAPRMIGTIAFGPDGLLWGIVDGTIFAMDVDTKQIVKSKMIRPSMYNSSKWLPYEIEWAPDGMIYTTLARKVYAIDPETLQYKLVVDSFVNSMTLGIDGSIYFAPNAGTSLSRIAVPETDATLYALTVGGNSIAGFSPGVLSYSVPLNDEAAINAVTAQAGASAVIKEDNRTVGSKTLIDVTAADGKSKLEYVINWTAKPVDPIDPETPTPTPTPEPNPKPDSTLGTTPAPKPDGTQSIEGTQSITASQLTAAGQDKLTIEVMKGIQKVELPINAAVLTNEKPIVLQNEHISIELAPAVLKQLQQLAAEQGLSNALIQVSMQMDDKSASDRLVANVQRDTGAALTAVSGIYNINLSVSAKEAELSLKELDAPVTLSFPIPNDVNEKLLGIYNIANDGSLAYAGGIVKDGIVSADITQSGKYIVLEFDKVFNDVPEGHWAAQVIKEMAMMLIANGINATDFAPEREITRAEFVTIITRALGLQASAGDVQFSDVKPGDWYAQAVAAAFKAGIVNGKGDSKFDPNQAITREEMAVIAIRALKFQQVELSFEADGDVFADNSSISPWAAEAVNAAYRLGLVNGRGSNMFVPKDNLMRAEAIQVIYNLLKK